MAEYNPDAEYIQALEEERDDWARKHAAAETALASARATIGRVEEYVGYLERDIAAARKNREPQTGMHVPYHGAFCSAPISTIKDLERFARSMRDLLTSHPAPVAAPSLLAAASKVTQLWADLSSQELYGEALDELLQDDRQELEDAMQALRDAKSAPVAAPCAGCAAARELLASIVKYAREDRAETPGVTRLARALVRAESWLKEHP